MVKLFAAIEIKIDHDGRLCPFELVQSGFDGTPAQREALIQLLNSQGLATCDIIKDEPMRYGLFESMGKLTGLREETLHAGMEK